MGSNFETHLPFRYELTSLDFQQIRKFGFDRGHGLDWTSQMGASYNGGPPKRWLSLWLPFKPPHKGDAPQNTHRETYSNHV